MGKESIERFHENYIPEPNSGCWLWTGSVARENKPYGRMGHNGKTVSAHRYSYETFIGEIPEGLWVLHKCDNPACVNPNHLFLGTSDDNVSDRDSKGRQALGIKHGRVKLTESQVIEIFLSKEGSTTVGRRYGIIAEHVRRIRMGLRWGHLTKNLKEHSNEALQRDAGSPARPRLSLYQQPRRS